MTILKSGLIHWFLQRLSALTLIILIFILLIFKNSFISNLLLILVFLHLKTGFETLIEDYTHDYFFRIFGNCLLRLIIIYCIKFIFLLSIF